ncbi:MAG: flagellar basal body P-ring protein FlgI [Deltaproteobacteria bacterium]|nr:flagellar basal body P-ring protein FlgI [Deltaproteobacteria bacterium]
MRLKCNIFSAVITFVVAHTLFAQTKLKDLVNVKGVRSNQLIGYGLVMGLTATGDSNSATTRRSAASMLRKMGLKASENEIALGNVASIIATAELPPFARIGDKIDVRISANSDAKSLAGGTLLQTHMRAGDGKTYVIAQGAVVIGQADGQGARVLTVARVPQGGVVENEFSPDFAHKDVVRLSLKHPDFTTNYRIVKAINAHFKGFYADSQDPTTVNIQVPFHFRDRIIPFVSEVEQLSVNIDRRAVVVLNERTGTVVLGSQVTINPVTISHGDLSIKVTQKDQKEEADQSMLTVKGATVGELVEALNLFGVKPVDLVGIIQAMHTAGALNGDLEFM